MLETVGQRSSLLSAIEKARNSSVVAYMLHDNALIADDAIPQLYDKLQSVGRRDRIDLILYARGGVLEVCWRVLNLLREYCDHLGIIVANRVQGPAALLALGADEIVMGPLSELGGLETARKHPLLPRDETGQPLPVTLGEIRALLAWRSGHGGAPPPADTVTGVLAPMHDEDLELKALFPYIHPAALAHLVQADALGRDVARKALQMHIHPEDTARMERIVAMFNGGFHSPLYTAGKYELREAGLPVVEAEPHLWGQIWELVQLYQAAIYSERSEQSMPGALFRYVCLIESTTRTTGLHQSFTQADGQERILQIGWETAVKGPGPGPSIGPGGMSNN